jgi:hypothetical protein
LKGGKNGEGWDFGQIPSNSDFYFLSDLSGVSYIKDLYIPPRPRNLPESTLPCSGKHEINLLWKAEREE